MRPAAAAWWVLLAALLLVVERNGVIVKSCSHWEEHRVLLDGLADELTRARVREAWELACGRVE